jgi:hypothetical protein
MNIWYDIMTWAYILDTLGGWRDTKLVIHDRALGAWDLDWFAFQRAKNVCGQRQARMRTVSVSTLDLGLNKTRLDEGLLKAGFTVCRPQGNSNGTLSLYQSPKFYCWALWKNQ